MAKSKLKQLQEALAAGDVETAQRLSKEMEPKKAPKKAKKAPVKRATTKRTTTRKKPAETQPEPQVEDGVNVLFRDDAYNVMAGGSRQISTNGERNYAQRQSLAGTKFKPEIVQEAAELPTKHAKLDKKLQKAKVTPRPGQAGAAREAVKMLKIRCDGCGVIDTVAEGVFERLDEEAMYKCNRCSCRGR